MASVAGCKPSTAKATRTGGGLAAPVGGGGWQGAQQVLSDVHPCRDLKPTNVLLDEDDRPVLMDLGSMNQARIEVNSSRKAMAVQVGAQ